jgi:hypothetical protein
MRFLNVVLFILACAVIVMLGTEADNPTAQSVKNPNPMKANQEQFARMERADMYYVQK